MSNFKDTTEQRLIRPQTVILKSSRPPRRVSFPMDVQDLSGISMPTSQLNPLSKIAETVVRRKDIVSEYNFNKRQLTRHKSDITHVTNGLQKGLKLHNGDQNLSESTPQAELSNRLRDRSLNERILRIEVSNPIYSQTPPIKDSSMNGGVQPLFRPRALSQSDKSGIDPKIQSVQHDLTHAKLAMMRKKLESLPSRHRFCSDLESSFDSSIRRSSLKAVDG